MRVTQKVQVSYSQTESDIVFSVLSYRKELIYQQRLHGIHGTE